MSNRAGIPAAIALIALIIVIASGLAEGSEPTAYRLEPLVGWTRLEQVNPYAMFAANGSWDGWGNAGGTAQIVGRAVFEPDLSRAEISAEFVPVSREIIASDSRLFIVPVGRRLEWKVIVTVRNPNDVAMTNVKVQNQFGKAFRIALAGKSRGDARTEDGDARGMLPASAGFVWDIGYMGPGEAARAELTVATGQTAGRAEFVQDGVYSIDTGFQLTYFLAGMREVRNASPCTVMARENPGALHPDIQPHNVGASTQPSTEKPVVTPSASQQGSATITRRSPELTPDELAQLHDDGVVARDIHRDDLADRFTVTAKGVENVSEDGGRFVVPANQYAEWEVELKVHNPFRWLSWGDWMVTLEFGPELEVCITSHSAVTTVSQVRHPVSGITTVTWASEASLGPQDSETAKLQVVTRSPNHYAALGDHVFADSMQLRYKLLGFNILVGLCPPICVRVKEGEAHATIGLSATRLDWLVRKPGTYAVLATEIMATGYGFLSVQFSEFGDLMREDDDPGAIAAFYGFGDTLADVEDAENADMERWSSAEALNDQVRILTLSPSEPFVERIWSMISVGENVPSAEYENKGVITFIVSNN